RSPRHAPDLPPPRKRLEASDRFARPHEHTVREHDAFRDQSPQRAAPEGDRERRAPRPHRRPVVAILPDGAQPRRAFSRKPPPGYTRPRRRAATRWPGVAGRWPVVREVLERSRAGKEGALGSLLLLEWRAAASSERAEVGWDRGDPAGVG